MNVEDSHYIDILVKRDFNHATLMCFLTWAKYINHEK